MIRKEIVAWKYLQGIRLLTAGFPVTALMIGEEWEGQSVII